MWWGLAQLLLLGLAVAVALASWLVVRRLRRPPRRTYASAVARGRPGDPGELDEPRGFTEVRFGARGRGVVAWNIPGDDPGGPVVVLTPGWGDSRVGALARLGPVLPHASRAVAWDPPGLGETPGRWGMGVTDPGDLRSILDETLAPGERAVLAGWSAGAGVSIVAGAGDGRVVGVVAEAPYRLAWTPAINVLRQAGLPHRVTVPLAFAALGLRLGVGPRWAGFDRAEGARALRAPLLLLHGAEDEICPVRDTLEIAEAAPDARTVVVEGAGHNDLWTDDRYAPACAEAVAGFLRETAVPARVD